MPGHDPGVLFGCAVLAFWRFAVVVAVYYTQVPSTFIPSVSIAQSTHPLSTFFALFLFLFPLQPSALFLFPFLPSPTVSQPQPPFCLDSPPMSCLSPPTLSTTPPTYRPPNQGKEPFSQENDNYHHHHHHHHAPLPSTTTHKPTNASLVPGP